MIINKRNKFCSFIRKFMFNLQEFQFSKVSKSTSNQTKKTNSNQLSEKTEKQLICQKQYQTVNISVKEQKYKKKKLTHDPLKTYQNIKLWRKTNIAPVDTMGCDRLSQATQSQEIQKYQTLIALMLSIQTTDQITSMIIKRLQQHGLTPKSMAQISQSNLIELIYESNFNKRKAKNIIQVSKYVLQNGLPKNQKDLLKLPGIGIKISMIYLRSAEGILDGIGVDTHVHRICNRLGWVETSNPNETEIQLQKIFPQKYWADINVSLVGFGQILCNAKKPLCSSCPVNFQCPSSLLKQNKLQW